jgi:hypothetical protein
LDEAERLEILTMRPVKYGNPLSGILVTLQKEYRTKHRHSDSRDVTSSLRMGPRQSNIGPSHKDVEFIWIYGGSDVKIIGSWDWKTMIPLIRQDGEPHRITLSLPLGEYQYKFVVDGEWRLDVGKDKTIDDNGNENNMIMVSDI